MFKKAAVALAALALPAAALVAPAQASAATSNYHPASVKWVKQARVKGNHATVKAKYRCYGGNQNTHIWVSLKQGPKIANKTIAELETSQGTSRDAVAWYDTNPTDPQEVYIICNGHWQVQTFKLTRHMDKAKLTGRDRGKTFMQFCLFDSHVAAGPEAEPSAWVYKFINVKKVKKLHYHYNH
jgi:bifunctional N-acetylglucosamine-1-phosphate-uridyltransferase/glucosamine-1-phosphate-acetyltransferase GlmU-like protein